MSVKLYDLCSSDVNHRFSPFCYRVKPALYHKGVSFESIGTPFLEIPKVEGGSTKTVPFLVDGQNKITGSFEIGLYLEKAYPNAPTLFAGEGGVAISKFVESFANTVLMPGIAGQVVKIVHDSLGPEDQAYFRETREARFGTTLEALHEAREGKREGFLQSIQPLRALVSQTDFIGGDSPLFADYIAYGPFKWMLILSDEDILPKDDPILAWVARIEERFPDLK